MAKCPKCDQHLRIIDWRPNCPNCGVNLVYYGMEERLLTDANQAEAEHSHFQKKIDRVKASFIGSKFAILRIILTVLPIACLFLPWAKVLIKAPYIDETVKVSIIKVGTKVAELDFDALFELMGSEILGTPFTMFFVALVCMLLTAVIAFASLVLLFLSASPKGIARNITLASMGLVLTGVGTFMFTKFNSSFSTLFPGTYSGKLEFGIFVLMAAFALVIVINAIIGKVGLEVKYKQTYICGIPSEEYFAAVEAGIDVLGLQLHVTEEEAAIAIEKALEDAGIRVVKKPGAEDAVIEKTKVEPSEETPKE